MCYVSQQVQILKYYPTLITNKLKISTYLQNGSLEMSNIYNELCKEQIYEEIVQKYMDKGYTEEEAKAKADDDCEKNKDFWIRGD